jgi:hypothetical protein
MNAAQVLRGLARHQREVATDLRDRIAGTHQERELDLLAAQDLEHEAHAATELKNATWWLNLGLSLTSVVRSGIAAVDSLTPVEAPPAGTSPPVAAEETPRTWLDNVQDGISKPLSFAEGRLSESDQAQAAGKREVEKAAGVREKLAKALQKDVDTTELSADTLRDMMQRILLT